MFFSFNLRSGRRIVDNFLHKDIVTLTSVPGDVFKSLGGGYKSMRANFFSYSAISNARLCVRAPWAECRGTYGAKAPFGTKRKYFPAPLVWRRAQSLLAVAVSQPASPL